MFPGGPAASRRLPFDFQVHGSIGRLALADLAVGPLTIDKLELEVSDLGTDPGAARAERFQRRRTQLVALAVRVAQASLDERVAQLKGPLASAGITQLSARLADGYVAVRARAADGLAAADLSFHVELVSAGTQLRALASAIRIHGHLPTPGPVIADRLLVALTGASETRSSERPSARGLCDVEIDLVGALLWHLLPPSGWRLPAVAGIELTQVRIARAAIEIAYGPAGEIATATAAHPLAAAHDLMHSADHELRAGHLDDAMRGYRALLASGGPDQPLLLERILALAATRPAWFFDGLELARQALGRWPGFAPGHAALASITLAQGDAREAARHLEESARRASTSGDDDQAALAALAAGRLLRVLDPRAATHLYQLALEHDPASIEAADSLADRLADEQRWPELVRSLRGRIATAEPDRAVRLHLRLADALVHQLGDPAGAERELAAARELAPEDPAVHEMTAEVLEVGDPSGALAAWRKVAAIAEQRGDRRMGARAWARIGDRLAGAPTGAPASERAHDQAHERAHDQAHERAHDHAHERAHHQAHARPHELATDQPHARAHELATDRAHERTHELATDQPHERAHDQVTDRASDLAGHAWRRALELDPMQGDALVGLAQAAAVRGEHAAAVELYERLRGLGLPPQAAARHELALARSLIALGRTDDARAGLRRATLGGGEPAAEAHAMLAAIADATLDREHAAAELDTAITSLVEIAAGAPAEGDRLYTRAAELAVERALLLDRSGQASAAGVDWQRAHSLARQAAPEIARDAARTLLARSGDDASLERRWIDAVLATRPPLDERAQLLVRRAEVRRRERFPDLAAALADLHEAVELTEERSEHASDATQLRRRAYELEAELFAQSGDPRARARSLAEVARLADRAADRVASEAAAAAAWLAADEPAAALPHGTRAHAQLASSAEVSPALRRDVLITLGEAAWRQRAWPDVIRAYRGLITDPGAEASRQATFRYRLAVAAERVSDHALALEALRPLLDDPEATQGASPELRTHALRLFADLAERTGELAEAATALEQAAAIGGEGTAMARADAVYRAGELFRRTERGEDAIRCFEAALRISDSHLPALDALEATWRERGELERVSVILGRKVAATARQPGRQKPLLSRLGDLQDQLGRPDVALATHQRALEIDPLWRQSLRYVTHRLRDTGQLVAAAGGLAQLAGDLHGDHGDDPAAVARERLAAAHSLGELIAELDDAQLDAVRPVALPALEHAATSGAEVADAIARLRGGPPASVVATLYSEAQTKSDRVASPHGGVVALREAAARARAAGRLDQAFATLETANHVAPGDASVLRDLVDIAIQLRDPPAAARHLTSLASALTGARRGDTLLELADVYYDQLDDGARGREAMRQAAEAFGSGSRRDATLRLLATEAATHLAWDIAVESLLAIAVEKRTAADITSLANALLRAGHDADALAVVQLAIVAGRFDDGGELLGHLQHEIDRKTALVRALEDRAAAAPTDEAAELHAEAQQLRIAIGQPGNEPLHDSAVPDGESPKMDTAPWPMRTKTRPGVPYRQLSPAPTTGRLPATLHPAIRATTDRTDWVRSPTLRLPAAVPFARTPAPTSNPDPAAGPALSPTAVARIAPDTEADTAADTDAELAIPPDDPDSRSSSALAERAGDVSPGASPATDVTDEHDAIADGLAPARIATPDAALPVADATAGHGALGDRAALVDRAALADRSAPPDAAPAAHVTDEHHVLPTSAPANSDDRDGSSNRRRVTASRPAIAVPDDHADDRLEAPADDHSDDRASDARPDTTQAPPALADTTETGSPVFATGAHQLDADVDAHALDDRASSHHGALAGPDATALTGPAARDLAFSPAPHAPAGPADGDLAFSAAPHAPPAARDLASTAAPHVPAEPGTAPSARSMPADAAAATSADDGAASDPAGGLLAPDATTVADRVATSLQLVDGPGAAGDRAGLAAATTVADRVATSPQLADGPGAAGDRAGLAAATTVADRVATSPQLVDGPGAHPHGDRAGLAAISDVTVTDAAAVPADRVERASGDAAGPAVAIPLPAGNADAVERADAHAAQEPPAIGHADTSGEWQSVTNPSLRSGPWQPGASRARRLPRQTPSHAPGAAVAPTSRNAPTAGAAGSLPTAARIRAARSAADHDAELHAQAAADHDAELHAQAVADHDAELHAQAAADHLTAAWLDAALASTEPSVRPDASAVPFAGSLVSAETAAEMTAETAAETAIEAPAEASPVSTDAAIPARSGAPATPFQAWSASGDNRPAAAAPAEVVSAPAATDPTSAPAGSRDARPAPEPSPSARVERPLPPVPPPPRSRLDTAPPVPSTPTPPLATPALASAPAPVAPTPTSHAARTESPTISPAAAAAAPAAATAAPAPATTAPAPAAAAPAPAATAPAATTAAPAPATAPAPTTAPPAPANEPPAPATAAPAPTTTAPPTRTTAAPPSTTAPPPSNRRAAAPRPAQPAASAAAIDSPAPTTGEPASELARPSVTIAGSPEETALALLLAAASADRERLFAARRADPDDPGVLLALLAHLGDREPAVRRELLEETARTAHGRALAIALHELAALAREQRDALRATALWIRAYETDPTYEPVWMPLADAYAASDDFTAARELYEAIAVSEAYDPARRAFAAERAESLGRDDAIVSGEIAARGPSDLEQAERRAASEDWSGAIDAAERAAAARPDDLKVLETLERIYDASGNIAAASEAIGRQLMRIDDLAVRARLWRRRARMFRDALGRDAEAYRCLKEAHACSPADPEIAYQLRTAAMVRGEWQLAASLMYREIAAAGNPRDRGALHLELAMIYDERLEDAAQAQNHYEQALAFDPTIPAVKLPLARRYEAIGRSSDAARLYEDAAGHARPADRAGLLEAAARCREVAAQASEPDLAAQLDRAEAAGDRDAALELASQLWRAEPGHPAAFRTLASTHRSSGDLAALTELTSVRTTRAETADERATAWLEVARLAEEVGALDQAARAYDLALIEDPGHAGALDARGALAFRLADFATADLIYRDLGAGESVLGDDELALRRSIIAEQLGRDDEALQLAQLAARLAPGRRDLVGRVQELATRVGDRTVAIAAARQTLELTPLDDDEAQLAIQFALVELLRETGQLDEVVAQLEKLLRDHPMHAQAIEALAHVHAARGDWQAATRYLQQLVPLAPSPGQRAERLYELGEAVLVNVDDVDRADDAFLRASDLDPGHVPTLRRLLDVYWRADDPGGIVEVATELADKGALGHGLTSDGALARALIAAALVGDAQLAQQLQAALGDDTPQKIADALAELAGRTGRLQLGSASTAIAELARRGVLDLAKLRAAAAGTPAEYALSVRP